MTTIDKIAAMAGILDVEVDPKVFLDKLRDNHTLTNNEMAVLRSLNEVGIKIYFR